MDDSAGLGVIIDGSSEIRQFWVARALIMDKDLMTSQVASKDN